MSLLHVEGVTHWSIPVNNLEEAEAFYGDLLGLTPVPARHLADGVFHRRWAPYPALRTCRDD